MLNHLKFSAVFCFALIIGADSASAGTPENAANRQFPESALNLRGAEQANRVRVNNNTIVLDVVAENGRVVRSGDKPSPAVKVTQSNPALIAVPAGSKNR